MNLKILGINEIEVDIHAQLIYEARQSSPLRNNERTIERIKEAVGKLQEQSEDYVVIAAYDATNDGLLGQLSMRLNWGELAIVNPWQPIVHPDANHQEVATALIEHSKKLVKTHSKTRLEAWMELKSQQDKEMSTLYIPWFEKCGFDLKAKEYYMDTPYSKLRESSYSIPNEIEVVAMDKVSPERTKDAVLETFRNSLDIWFVTMTESQQESSVDEWLKMDETFDSDSSLVFLDNGEIIGYNVMRIVDNSVEVGPIGVISPYRGKGLGRALLLASVEKLESKNPQTVWLTVCTDNAPAYKLYSSLGFVNQYEILFYIWMP